MPDATRDAKQLVRNYGEMWSEQDTARIPDLVSESFTGTFPETEEPIEGHKGLEELMREFTTAFPDFQVEITDLLTTENTVIAKGTYTMTHEGEYHGIPPTQRDVEISALSIFLIADGKIQEHREYHDRQAVLEQLGVTEA